MVGADLLQCLFGSDEGEFEDESLERFVGERLETAGEWSSWRTSDGITSHRVVERAPDRVVLCGTICTIEQTLHPFWLIVERDRAAPDRPTWSLFFDVDTTLVSPRRARDAVQVSRPDELHWRVTLSGAGRY